MSRCVGVALTIVAAMLATGVPPAAAETEAGPLLVSGEFGIGGRTITGRFSSAKFTEYTNIRPGLVFGGDLLFEEEEQRWYLRALVDFVDEDDQSYALEMGRWGHYGLTLDYREYPHEYSSNAVTPYTKGRDGNLTLPPGWNFDPAALSGQLGFASEGRNLGFRMLEGGGDAFYRPTEEVELTADYHIVDKHGTRPFSVTFGFPNFTTVASPLNEKTHTVSANARWIRDAFNLDSATSARSSTTPGTTSRRTTP